MSKRLTLIYSDTDDDAQEMPEVPEDTPTLNELGASVYYVSTRLEVVASVLGKVADRIDGEESELLFGCSHILHDCIEKLDDLI